MLELKEISFSYIKGKEVLHNIGFSLKKEETIGIVGASGCGKSTLLRIISSILPSSEDNSLSGEVSIDGLSTDNYRKTGKLSFMFQEATLMPNLSVRENIELPLKIKGIKDSSKVKDLLKTVGLTDYAGYLPKQLSGGMKTRVSLARSFISDPGLLLLDEPFSALDIAWKSKLYIELEQLKKLHKTTVVLVTHDIQEALLLCDIVVVLKRNGEIISEEKINSRMSTEERVLNVSAFLKEVYSNHYLPIQRLIMNDGVRNVTNDEEADRILNRIISITGNIEKEKIFHIETINGIRKFSHLVEVNKVLCEAYLRASTIDFKYHLIWEILNYPDLSIDLHEQIFEFYIENIDYFSYIFTERYRIDGGSILDAIIEEKVKNNQIPVSKKWIYLCILYASEENEQIVAYLDKVIEGKIVELNNGGFIKKVAQILKEKIINEKIGHIFSL